MTEGLKMNLFTWSKLWGWGIKLHSHDTRQPWIQNDWIKDDHDQKKRASDEFIHLKKMKMVAH